MKTSYTRYLIAATVLALAASTAQAKPPKPAKKIRVAVLEFENSSSDDGLEALGKGLQSMVTTDLSKVKSLTLVERARLMEIVKEQKLGRSGAVDKRTAAKIGKLSGASHLLTGTYTVHGSSMRLDARLFATKSGKVLLAEEMTGDKDAFFELEKSLVKKLIKGLGIDLAPKERAGIAKIHTADFKAFARYSMGVQQFDQKKYEAAMKSLREASAIDEDFDLARLTLDQYGEVVAQLRARADSLEVTKKELAKLKMDDTARADAEVVEALLTIIDAKKTRPSRRYAALVYLAGMYNPNGRNHGRVSRFQDRQDQFIARRTAAAVGRQMLGISLKSYPTLPLIPTATQPPKTTTDLKKRLDGMTKQFESKPGEHTRERAWQRDLAKNLTRADGFAEVVTMTPREGAALVQKALKATKDAAEADERTKTTLLEQLSKRYLAMGDLGAASSALSQRAKLETSASRVERLAEDIERYGALAKRLRTVKHRALAEESLAARGRYADLDDLDKFDKTIDPKLLRAIRGIRTLERWGIYHDEHFFFSGAAAFLIMGDNSVVTGARTDGLHSDAVRYYRSPASVQSRPTDTLVIVGESGFTGVRAKFRLNFKAAKDFWPINPGVKTVAALELGDDRPTVGFAFGIRDVSLDDFRNEETKKNMYPGPRALALQITANTVQLVELGREEAFEKRVAALPTKVLSKKSRRSKKTAVSVTVEVDKRSVRAKIGGDTYRFDLPSGARVNGYAGFHATGLGYVEILNPSFEAR